MLLALGSVVILSDSIVLFLDLLLIISNTLMKRKALGNQKTMNTHQRSKE